MGQGGAPHAAGPAVETLVLGSRGVAGELDGEPGEGRRKADKLHLRCFRGNEAPTPIKASAQVCMYHGGAF